MKYDPVKLNSLKANPAETLEAIVECIGVGGSLVELCEFWEVSFHAVSSWLRQDDGRNKAYLSALESRAEWSKEKVLMELKAISLSDLRQLFSETGQLLPVDQWPVAASKAVAALEIVEEFAGRGSDREQVGFTKKLKLWDKGAALANWGKTMAMFIEKHEHSGKVTLEDLVNSSRESTEKKE